MSVNTSGYQGEQHWSAKVNTNDPVRDLFYLELQAFVNVPVHVSPRHVFLNAVEGRQLIRGVEIRAGLDKPLVLEPDQFSLEGKVTYRIEEIEKGHLFRILFAPLPAAPAQYEGFLRLNTNYSEQPTVTIRIVGRSFGDGRQRTLDEGR